MNDNLKSIELEDQNSYAYRNLGLYHFYTNESDKARDCFQFTYNLDKDTPLLEEYMGKIDNTTNTKLV